MSNVYFVKLVKIAETGLNCGKLRIANPKFGLDFQKYGKKFIIAYHRPALEPPPLIPKNRVEGLLMPTLRPFSK